MGFLDKAKSAAGQAAAKAKRSAEDLQLKVDLGEAYSNLGEATYALIERGELSADKLEPQVARVRELRAKAAADESPADEPAPEPPQANEPAALRDESSE
jgi:hypothetical protein